ncbi:hypothetical protein [Aurantiacibacter gilvus]|uniref:Uncharacterized protein n=1 Tax=Aurantiacibacter gilvus TaxID=3139141 RepID=A0ABU9ID15_9SPHN
MGNLPLESATLPLPTALRDDATIVSLDEDAAVRVLREGDGIMVCMADPPGDDRFDARCYHREFITYIYRLRQLRALGVERSAIDLQIAEEMEAGTLHVTMAPTAGYRMIGPLTSLTEDATAWTDEMDRWQSLHIPRAIAENMGVITESEGNMPYVMASGELWSHVMIVHDGE